MAIKMDLDLEHDFGEGPVKLSVNVVYDPGRPAPPCSNPDSPAFADSGDPEEMEMKSVFVCYCQRMKAGYISLIDVDDELEEAIFRAAREQYEERAREMAHGEGC